MPSLPEVDKIVGYFSYFFPMPMWTSWTFDDPLPPHLVHVVIGCPLISKISSLLNSLSSKLSKRYYKTTHSALIMNLIKLKGTAKLTAQGKRVCLKDAKYILFEILESQTWKGRTTQLLPAEPAKFPNRACLASKTCPALPCLIC